MFLPSNDLQATPPPSSIHQIHTPHPKPTKITSNLPLFFQKPKLRPRSAQTANPSQDHQPPRQAETKIGTPNLDREQQPTNQTEIETPSLDQERQPTNQIEIGTPSPDREWQPINQTRSLPVGENGEQRKRENKERKKKREERKKNREKKKRLV